MCKILYNSCKQEGMTKGGCYPPTFLKGGGCDELLRIYLLIGSIAVNNNLHKKIAALRSKLATIFNNI